MIEFGSGQPLVVIPGFPGPWQYVRPAVEALAARFRVLTMSLGRECTIEDDVGRIAAGLDERRIDRAVICGISLGGLVAVRFAATYPQRTAALVLVSSPGPGMRLRPSHRFYARWPHLFGPLFFIEMPFRLRRELHWSQVRAALTTPVSFSKMAKRGMLLESTDIAADCRRIVAPTLVITGEPQLDQIVPVASTMEYLRAIPGAVHAVLSGTGHLGSITRSTEFANVVATFVAQSFQGRDGGPEKPASRKEVA